MQRNNRWPGEHRDFDEGSYGQQERGYQDAGGTGQYIEGGQGAPNSYSEQWAGHDPQRYGAMRGWRAQYGPQQVFGSERGMGMGSGMGRGSEHRDWDRDRQDYGAGSYGSIRGYRSQGGDGGFGQGGSYGQSGYSQGSGYGQSGYGQSRYGQGGQSYDQGYGRAAGSGESGGYGQSGSMGAGSQRGEWGAQFGGGPGTMSAGRSRGAGKGPKGYQRSDERIREDVSDRLLGSWELDAENIEVSVDGGEVTLSGTISERNDKWEAEQLCESVLGVKEVINQLRVRRAGQEHSGSSKDSSSKSDSSTDRASGASSSGGTMHSSATNRAGGSKS